LQPFLVFLLAELGLFYLAVMGDVYLTDALVRWYGSQVEVNPRVKKMYDTGKFLRSWVAVAGMSAIYLMLGAVGDTMTMPYVPFIIAVLGTVLPLFAMSNLVKGSMVFYQLKKLRAERSRAGFPLYR
jgi:hypothetical protein